MGWELILELLKRRRKTDAASATHRQKRLTPTLTSNPERNCCATKQQRLTRAMELLLDGKASGT